MENKRLTAVEWLIDKVEDHFCLLPVDLIKQAKAMEKIQIRASYCKGVNDFYLYEEGEEINWEQYYNETYGTSVDKKG